ncbi:MAG: hypothetical protein WBF53_15190 [Litorimonas sp.]
MTPPLTPDAVREMLAAATSGPWKLALNPEGDYIICQDETGDALATEWFGSVPNTQLMSAAPALAQAWLDAVERVAELEGAVRVAMDELVGESGFVDAISDSDHPDHKVWAILRDAHAALLPVPPQDDADAQEGGS